MKLFITALLLVGTLFGYENISTYDFVSLKESGVNIIDIRTEREWKDSGVIEGSHLITSFQENGTFNQGEFLKKLKDVVKSKDEMFVIVCRTGTRTKIIADYLEKLGFSKVYNYDSGIVGWQKDKQPLTKY